MRFIGFSLLCVFATARSLAQAAEPAPAAKLSSRLVEEIRSSLPKYQPPPANAPSESIPATPDADILVLPKVVVKESAQPKIKPNDLMTAKALDKKLAKEFKNSLEGLDAVLNGFSIPLLSPSMAARGRAVYEARRLEDLNNFIGNTRAADSKSATEMKKAVDEMNRADEWRKSAAGGG